MGKVFDLRTGCLAIGDPTMGLVNYNLGLPPGSYRLGPLSFLMVDHNEVEHPGEPFIRLDSPYVFALDAAHLEEFKGWYHQLGNECSYMILTIVDRLDEFEATVRARVGFYWEEELSGINQEGVYVLDPTCVVKQPRKRRG